jgi:hypothetical protein
MAMPLRTTHVLRTFQQDDPIPDGVGQRRTEADPFCKMFCFMGEEK